jgi:conjugal transfer pilus assembly protein TraV
MSVTGIEANARANNLPSLRSKEVVRQGEMGEDSRSEAQLDDAPKPIVYGTGYEQGERVSPAAMEPPYSGVPLRTQPRVLRIWMAPFEDAEGDLHDQKYFYITIHSGRWVLEANQVNIQQQFKHVYPLGQPERPAKKNEKEKDAGGDRDYVDMNGVTRRTQESE